MDRQLLLAAIDSLAHFGGARSPVHVQVIHRAAIDPDVVPWFDSAPRLVCTHRTLGEEVAAGQEARMGHRWREFATLAVARLAKSPFYLVLDDSSICVRPLDVDGLVREGRAITHQEPLTLHPESLDASHQLLGSTLTHGVSLSTLPVVMSSELALRTLARIAPDAGGADAKLAAASEAHLLWTANSLYSTACQTQLHRFHLFDQEDGALRSLHGDVSVWSDGDDISSWDPVLWTSRATHGYFLVVKSCFPDRGRLLASRCYALLK